jgi:hypothetical protein
MGFEGRLERRGLIRSGPSPVQTHRTPPEQRGPDGPPVNQIHNSPNPTHQTHRYRGSLSARPCMELRGK